MKELQIKSFLEYLTIITIWFLIFGKNVFAKSLMFVDYVPSTFFDFWKVLIMSNFIDANYAFGGLKLVFSWINLLPLLFTFSILISMLISYTYIRKLTHNGRIFNLLFALIFFFNPFVYSRIMIGQIGVLISYLLMPFFLFYLFNFFEKDMKFKELVKLIIAYTITGTFSMQFFVFNFIFFLFGSFWFYFYKNKFDFKKYLKVFALFLLLLILLNMFWIQGVFSNNIFSSINSDHERFFSPKLSENIPAVAKVIGMYGFWRESSYLRIFNLIPVSLWYIMLFILIALIILGYYIDNKNKKSKFFYSLFWIGLIFGVGISHPYTGRLFDFLFNSLPLFNGFRDSHKFVALIAISYAYLIPLSIIKIKEHIKIKKLFYGLIICLFVIFILIYNFPLIFLNNQIHPISYPQDYSQVNKFLNEQNTNGYIIYLPWQLYLTYSWSLNSSSDGRITVPINNLIQKDVISGTDTYGSSTELMSKINICLINKDVSCLENQGVEYILKDKCALYIDDYSWINSGPVFQTNCVDVYKINNKTNAQTQQIPLRFVCGVIISLTTLITILLLARSSKKQ